MGLFGFGKNEKMVKITDFFSAEDLQKIAAEVEPALSAGAYGMMGQTLGKGLMDYINRPNREYTYGKFGAFIKIAESFKSVVPALAPILQKGIEKYLAAK